jgi:hypothetical protein
LEVEPAEAVVEVVELVKTNLLAAPFKEFINTDQIKITLIVN